MRKRIALCMVALVLTLLGPGMALVVSRSFALTMERERARALGEEAAIARAVALETASNRLDRYEASTLQTRYSSKEMAVYLLRNGEPITGEALPEAEKLPELLRLGQADVIHRGHKIQQPILLKDRRQPFARKAGDFAAVRRFQPQQDAQQRRLARAGWRHQRRHAPLLQLAGEILQHGFAAEGLAQLMNRNHSRVSLLSSAPSAAMNSFSKPTLMSTITSVHANSSGVSR